MNVPFVTGVGRTLSADIAVPEHDRGKKFYANVLTTGKKPLWLTNLLNSQHTPIIGLGNRTDAHDKLPLQWMPHIQVNDVRTSVKRAIELGAQDLMIAKNDEWAVLSDPDGAAFGVVPVVPGNTVTAPPDESKFGCISWVDLSVSDASAACDFYSQVIGWSAQEVEMRDGENRYADYEMLDRNGKAAAGICHARGVNADIPPVWMLYLPVGDLSESVRVAKQEGGRIISEKDGNHAQAVIEDPVGACFAIVAG